MPRRRPRPKSRSMGSGIALVCAALLAAAPLLASCAYTYDDGLPPLGERSPSSAQPTPRYPPQPPPTVATEPPPQEWTPEMMSSWALQTLPDSNGVSYAFGYGLVVPEQPILASAVVPSGTLFVVYTCRGTLTAHLSLTIAGTALVDTDYACGTQWTRAFVVVADSVAEVQVSATGRFPSAYAFRIVRR